ncbi:MAG: BlaI/MecI/CopY family transcriptional regulator [Bacteroidia bacterium]|jgi:BlaI family penicillinase repressor|nr:MAG: BlaI/MecI/CopY family transcriptional regulator [Bacteroidia bacterium]
MEIRELTKAEEEVMQILWRLKKGFVKEILEKFEEPRPAYTTVSTIIRILQEKGFVDYKAYGRTHQYFPVITKDDYKKAQMSSFVKDYFSNSYQNMVSFFAREKNISVREMEGIMELMRKDTNGKQILK